MTFSCIAELVNAAVKAGKPLSAIVLKDEAKRSERSAQEIRAEMTNVLSVMRRAITLGINRQDKSFSGMVGGDAYILNNCKAFLGEPVIKAATYAIAINEVNAGMGKIVACPTAGSCGIVPGAIMAIADTMNCEEEKLVNALFTAAGIGEVIAANATVAGALGGCQAECGSAAAMAAAAVVEMLGGTPEESAQAMALALKNMLGLACDPVAGLVEVPCVKRNGFAAIHALVAAQMAMVGIKSVIPPDEVIESMYRIGLEMPANVRETSQGGLAVTPTAKAIEQKLAQE